jgi:glycosyltransferase involved in cell wall biosynthesis
MKNKMSVRTTSLRVAIVHDWLTGMRGGEAVLEALLDLYPDAELFTLLHLKGSCSDHIESRPIHTSFIDRLPLRSRFYRNYLPLFPAAIEEFDFHGFDLVISSSHCVARGVIVPPGVPHISYVHSPMRYVWDMYREYFPGRGLAQKFVIPFFANYLRMWDAASAHRVDRYVVNSAFVGERVRRYYGKESVVIHPPCVENFGDAPASKREDFYLVYGALVPYKRVDLAITAFKESGRRLIVAGHGPERNRLRKLAGNARIEFIDRPDHKLSRELFEKARGLIFPGIEDFGIVPVEAQERRCPVIAFRCGGALETVVHLKTGYFFNEQSPQSLNAALDHFERLTFREADFRKNVLRFTADVFRQKMSREIQNLIEAASNFR